MTISTRNGFYKGGIILSLLSVGLMVAGGYFVFAACLQAAEAASFRPGWIAQALGDRLSPAAAVPFFTMLTAALYSLVSIILIYYFFENTRSPELLFFALFVMSLSFEFLRLIIPLRAVFPFPALYVITASRLLLFARYFGLFSLFAASVYAAGLNVQRQQNAVFIVALAALIITIQIPIDGIIWDSTLMPRSGYRAMFAVVEAGIGAVTALTFFISAYTKGARSYVFIGVGSLLALAGRSLLIQSDTWFTPLPGFLALAVGTWLIASHLRREYLWL